MSLCGWLLRCIAEGGSAARDPPRAGRIPECESGRKGVPGRAEGALEGGHTGVAGARRQGRLSDREAGLLAESQHQVQRLDRHARGALAEIVQDPDQQQVAGRVRQHVESQSVGVVQAAWVEAEVVDGLGAAKRCVRWIGTSTRMPQAKGPTAGMNCGA